MASKDTTIQANHNGKQNKKKKESKKNDGNIFNYSDFPLPQSSRETMNNDNDDLLYSYYNMDNNKASKGGSQNKNSLPYSVAALAGSSSIPYRNRGAYRHLSSATSELVFRSANSTQRAMKELAQRKYEATQRKKAMVLLLLLVIIGTSIYYVTDVNYNLGVILQNEKNDGTVQEKASSSSEAELLGIMSTHRGSGQGDGNDGNEENDENQEQSIDEPQEEVIESGKEFLQPYRYFADLTTSPRESDSNFFFHIPRSGGQTIKDIIGKCLKKTLASEVGVRDGHGQDETLQVIEIDGAKYVNVDTTSIDGLHRAAAMGLASTGYSDVIASSYFGEVGMLFDLHHKGRAFVLLRDPIVRAVSMYYYKTQGDNPSIDPSVSIEDYAQGNGIENNWVTRFLTGRMEGELTKEDLEQAKEIIDKKFLIGFLDDGEETIYRLMKYFGFSFSEDETVKMGQEDCIKDLLKDGTNHNNVEYEIPKKGSQAAALIKWQTQFDMKLFTHSKEIFDAQTKIYGSKERKKELKKRKKDGN